MFIIGCGQIFMIGCSQLVILIGCGQIRCDQIVILRGCGQTVIRGPIIVNC